MDDKWNSTFHPIWCFVSHILCKFFTSPKPYIVLTALSTYILWYSNKIRHYLVLKQVTMNFLEYYILLSTDNEFYFFLMTGLIFLISDCPFTPKGTGYYLLRSNRRSWFCAQLIYIFAITLLVNISLLFISTISLVPHITWDNLWSVVVQRTYSLTGDPDYVRAFVIFPMSSFGMLNSHMTLMAAFALSISFSILWMTALGVISLGAALYTSSKLGFFVVGIFIFIGRITTKIPYTPAGFLNSVSLVYLSRWAERWCDGMGYSSSVYIRSFSIEYAIAFFTVVIMISCVLGLRWAKKYDFCSEF